MITRAFPPGLNLVAMSYNNRNELTIQFKTQARTYENVDSSTAYGLYYQKTGTGVMSYYSNIIKGKFNVKTVTKL